jgi:serine/threonine-protein kinase
MGTVFKARQLGLERWVALKILPPHYATDPQSRDRFLREAQAIARLEHPHILPVYDFGQQNGYTYMVMRYVDRSRTLADVMDQPIPIERALSYLDQIASALDHAHRHGVIHRDVKPTNILLQDNWVFLADFGLVRMLQGASQLTSTNAGAGTPAYMSPEQGVGGKIDTRTDIYAVGAITYEMLTGQVPHLAENAQALIYRRVHEPPPSLRDLNPDLPAPVDRAVQKALAPDPAQRFQTTGLFVTALRQAIQSAKTEAPDKTVPSFRPSIPVLPSPQPRPAPKPAPSSPLPWAWLLAGVAGVFVLLVLLASILFVAANTEAGLGGTSPSFTPIPTLAASRRVFFDDFDTIGLNRQKWQLVVGSGQVQVNNSRLQMNSQGQSFPLVYPANNPFPRRGNFSISLLMTYTGAGRQGTGFWLGTPQKPLYGVPLTDEDLLAGRLLRVWQDDEGWVIAAGEEETEIYRQRAPDTTSHEITVNYVENVYQVVLDGQEIYVSPPTNQRPAIFWLGNPVVAQTGTTWSGLEVDRVAVHALTDTVTLGPPSTPAAPAPTATLIPTETPAPTATATRIPPTATPAPVTQNCSLPAGETFRQGWELAQQFLGCPTGEQQTIPTIAEEAFQGGHTFWRSDTDQVYIVYDRTKRGGKELAEGQWQQAKPEWKWDGSEPNEGLRPPEGLVTPQRGFGWLWRTHLGGPEGPLGWALDREYGFDNIGQAQRFEHGLMFKGSGSRIYVLLDNGRFYAQ